MARQDIERLCPLERRQDGCRAVCGGPMRCKAALESLRETIATALQVKRSMLTIEDSGTTPLVAAWAGLFAVAPCTGAFAAQAACRLF